MYEYDDFLRTVMTTEISKSGTKATKNKYNNNGSILEETDEKGRVTKYTYDSMNRVVKTELIVGDDSKVTNTSYLYGSLNINNGFALELIDNAKIVMVTNKNGEVVGKTYTDSLGRTVREMSNGLYTDYTYDKNGRVYTTFVGGTDASNADLVVEGKLSVTTYDDNGNLTATIVNPEIEGTTFKVGDNSIVTKNEYDKSGNLKSSTDANGAVAKTTTNGSDQIMSVKDETVDGNIETTYEYDKNGQLVCETYSNGSCIRYEYDVYGNQIKKSTFDSADSLASVNVTDYTYDSDGNILKVVDSKSGMPYRYTYYEYDSYGRNISVAEINACSEPDEATINAAKLKYVYNVDDNIEKIYYPNNNADILKGIKFVYNKDKWITEIDGLFSNDETTVIRQYIYHNDGKVKTIKDYKNFLNKGSEYIERDYIYDVFDRVISMKYFNSTDMNAILEQYDKNSNITYERERFNYTNNVKDEEIYYTYNNLNQLIKSEKTDNLTYKTTTSIYQYDSVGNRTYEGVSTEYTVQGEDSNIGNYTHYSYNKLNQLISSTEIENDGTSTKTYSSNYSYDSKGNQIKAVDGKTGTTTSYTYDVENQLTDVKIEVSGEVIATQHNEYNGAGQRIKKTDTTFTDDSKESNTTCYYYEGSLLLYTTDENGNKTSQNIIGNQNNAFATIRYDSDKQSEYFYSKDVQGSTTNLIDNTGLCLKSYDYTDFGETEERFESKVDNEICYTGGVYDELTGLYYLNARYYDAENGSFLSQDTYRDGNLYGYCKGNPISYTDPSGHSAVVVSGGVYRKEKKDKGQYYYEFIETALKQIKNWSKLKEKKYWLIADNGWTKKDKSSFKKTAKKYGEIKIKYFRSSKKLIKILNGQRFQKDKIDIFTVFSHGLVGKIAFGYDYSYNSSESNKLDLTIKQISKIKKSSFNYPTSHFYTCNAATKNEEGKSFARRWSKRFWSTTTAYVGKTYYGDIRDTKIWDYLYDRGIRAARYYPVACDDATEKTYYRPVIRAIR